MRNTVVWIAALVALLPGQGRAQDTPYKVTLPGNVRFRLLVGVQALGDGRKVVKLVSQPVTGSAADVRLDGSLQAGANGQTEYLRLIFKLGDAIVQDVEATRLENGGYRVQTPAQDVVRRFGAPIYTPVDLFSVPGRRYDWAKGGVQKGVYVDSIADQTTLRPMTLEVGEKTTLMFGEAAVPVRTLKVTIKMGEKPEEKRVGTLWVGPFGEALKADPTVVGLPIQAKAPSKKLDGGGFETEFEGIPIKNRVRPTPQGLVVETTLNDTMVVSTLRTNAKGEPQSWQNSIRDRKFAMTVNGGASGELHYTVEAGNAELQTPGTGRPWFIPYEFVTELWETGKSPFAEMAVGDKREGDNYVLFTGQRESLPFTLERQDDVEASIGGQTATLHHYRFNGNVIYDYYTDGRRLIVALASDGIRFVREGWEAFADSRKAPEIPKPVESK